MSVTMTVMVSPACAQNASAGMRDSRLKCNALEVRTIRRIVDFIDAHYTEQISLRDVARELSYSPAYLTHTFSRLTGTAITACIIKRRIVAAQQLLRAGDTTVASTCERVGFNDLCYFTRQFVRLTGVTPGRYRSGVSGSVSALATTQ